LTGQTTAGTEEKDSRLKIVNITQSGPGVKKYRVHPVVVVTPTKVVAIVGHKIITK
jgi:hypothetical protein